MCCRLSLSRALCSRSACRLRSFFMSDRMMHREACRPSFAERMQRPVATSGRTWRTLSMIHGPDRPLDTGRTDIPAKWLLPRTRVSTPGLCLGSLMARLRGKARGICVGICVPYADGSARELRSQATREADSMPMRAGRGPTEVWSQSPSSAMTRVFAWLPDGSHRFQPSGSCRELSG